ncbi:putative phage holin [Rhodococcus pyridinivorans]
MRRLILAVAAVACGVVVAVFDPQEEARILLTTMTILAWLFVALYGFRSPWRTTEAGKTLMYTAVGIGLIGLQLISVWWFGDYPGRAEVRALVVSLLVLALLHRLIVLWRFQHEERGGPQ